MARTDPALAGRIPPGQTLTTKWPVLTYGLTPRFDPARWTFRCSGHRARGPGGRRRAPGAATRRARPRARPRRRVPAGRAKALLLEERQVGARLRVPGRQSAWLLGAERIPHARRPLERGAVLRPGDARDADDARGGRAQAPRAVIALRGGGGLAGLGKTLAANPPPPLSESAAAVLAAAAHARA